MIVSKYAIQTKKDVTCSIALISDTHGLFDKELIPKIREHEVDIITITGDLIDRKSRYSHKTNYFLEQCASISKTYMSFGNEECYLQQEDIESIKETGVEILDDKWINHSENIVVGGLTSAYFTLRKRYGNETNYTVQSNTAFLKEFSKQNGFKILLDHHPENYPLYTIKADFDLILSGHTHGGQIRLFGRGLYAPLQGFLPRYDGGVYDNKIVISRGMSNTRWIPRIGNPKELVIVNIIPCKM